MAWAAMLVAALVMLVCLGGAAAAAPDRPNPPAPPAPALLGAGLECTEGNLTTHCILRHTRLEIGDLLLAGPGNLTFSNTTLAMTRASCPAQGCLLEIRMGGFVRLVDGSSLTVASLIMEADHVFVGARSQINATAQAPFPMPPLRLDIEAYFDDPRWPGLRAWDGRGLRRWQPAARLDPIEGQGGGGGANAGNGARGCLYETAKPGVGYGHIRELEAWYGGGAAYDKDPQSGVHGGGAIFILVTGESLVLDGSITANGGAAQAGGDLGTAGGGAGGSIHLIVREGSISGDNGQIQVTGGRGLTGGAGAGGGGFLVTHSLVYQGVQVRMSGGETPSTGTAARGLGPAEVVLPAQAEAATCESGGSGLWLQRIRGLPEEEEEEHEALPRTRLAGAAVPPSLSLSTAPRPQLQGCFLQCTGSAYPFLASTLIGDVSKLNISAATLTNCAGIIPVTGLQVPQAVTLVTSVLVCDMPDPSVNSPFVLRGASLKLTDSILQCPMMRVEVVQQLSIDGLSSLEFQRALNISAGGFAMSSGSLKTYGTPPGGTEPRLWLQADTFSTGASSQIQLGARSSAIFSVVSSFTLVASSGIQADRIYIGTDGVLDRPLDETAVAAAATSLSRLPRTGLVQLNGQLVANFRISNCSLPVDAFCDPDGAANTPLERLRASGTVAIWVSAGRIQSTEASLVKGSVIQFCATNATLMGAVTADGLGCSATLGSGPGGHVNGLAGAGAGHGGRGGDSSESGGQRSRGGEPYDRASWPVSLGSGGGSQTFGGAGGGFLGLNASHTLVLGGRASACGNNGTGVIVGGGGGGAGGTIRLAATHLRRSAAATPAPSPALPAPAPLIMAADQQGILAWGGAPGSIDGGGGGGGLIFLEWLGGTIPAAPADGFPGASVAGGSTEWQTGGQGGSGHFFSLPTCGAGQEELFCRDCPTGRAKRTPSNEPCGLCFPGEFSNQTGLHRCFTCAPGRFSFYGAVECSSCTPGRFAEEPGTPFNCSLCSPGRFSSAPEATTCQSCAAGRFASGWGNTSCETCPPGLTTPSQGFSQCSPCSSKPKHSHWSAGQGLCEYRCSPGYVMPKCLTPFEVITDGLGGPLAFLALCMGSLIVLSLPFFWCWRRYRREQRRREILEIEEIRAQRRQLLSQDPRRRVSPGSDELKADPQAAFPPSRARLDDPLLRGSGSLNFGPRGTRGSSLDSAGSAERAARAAAGSSLPHALPATSRWDALYPDTALRAEDLQWHLHRIYFDGSNTAALPFQMRPAPDLPVQAVVDPVEYAIFAQRFNQAAEWQPWEEHVRRLLSLVYYPAGEQFQAWRREQRCKHLWLEHLKYDHGLLRDYSARALCQSLKLGFSPDHSLMYMDVLCTQGEDTAGWALGANQFPLVLPCAGDGSFFTPFHLDITDELVKSPRIFFGHNWFQFVGALNRYLRVVRSDRVGDFRRCGALRQAESYVTAMNSQGIGIGKNLPLGGIRIALGFVPAGLNCVRPALILDAKPGTADHHSAAAMAEAALAFEEAPRRLASATPAAPPVARTPAVAIDVAPPAATKHRFQSLGDLSPLVRGGSPGSLERRGAADSRSTLSSSFTSLFRSSAAAGGDAAASPPERPPQLQPQSPPQTPRRPRYSLSVSYSPRTVAAGADQDAPFSGALRHGTVPMTAQSAHLVPRVHMGFLRTCREIALYNVPSGQYLQSSTIGWLLLMITLHTVAHAALAITLGQIAWEQELIVWLVFPLVPFLAPLVGLAAVASNSVAAMRMFAGFNLLHFANCGLALLFGTKLALAEELSVAEGVAVPGMLLAVTLVMVPIINRYVAQLAFLHDKVLSRKDVLREKLDGTAADDEEDELGSFSANFGFSGGAASGSDDEGGGIMGWFSRRG